MNKRVFNALRKIAADEIELGMRPAFASHNGKYGYTRPAFIAWMKKNNPYFATLPESSAAGALWDKTTPASEDRRELRYVKSKLTDPGISESRRAQAVGIAKDLGLEATPFFESAVYYLRARGLEHAKQFKEGKRWPGMPLPKDTTPMPEGIPASVQKKLEERGNEMAYNKSGTGNGIPS